MARLARAGGARLRSHAWFVATAAVCLAAFVGLVTGGTGALAYPESFGDFYDYQAASLLHGHLDVPAVAISGEAFVVNGRFYGYFGPTPALLRLPFVAFGWQWQRLARPAMVAYYLASLVAAWALLRRARRQFGGPGALPSPLATVLFTLASGLGSSLLFLGSRAYTYHEAILCGAALALWSAWFALTWSARPGSRAWLGALACAALAVQARAPAGLFALALLGATAVAVGRRPEHRRLAAAVGVACVAGALSVNAVGYLKFGVFDGSPFEYSAQYDATRLARFDNRKFHLLNVTYTADAYLLRPHLQARQHFPWLRIDRLPRGTHPRARMDHLEPTAGLPYTMSALVGLAVFGAAVSLRRRSAPRRDLVLLGLGFAPQAAAMLCTVVVSQRYTGDFVPLLIAAGATGLAAVDGAPTGRRRTGLAVLLVLAAWSVVANMSLALWYQGEGVWGVPDDVKQNYHRLQQRIDAWCLPAPPGVQPAGQGR